MCRDWTSEGCFKLGRSAERDKEEEEEEVVEEEEVGEEEEEVEEESVNYYQDQISE